MSVRRKYIYMIINPEKKGAEAVIGAYTVKREMEKGANKTDMRGLKKYRFYDDAHNPMNLLPKEFV